MKNLLTITVRGVILLLGIGLTAFLCQAEPVSKVEELNRYSDTSLKTGFLFGDDMGIMRICQECGKEFYSCPHTIKRGGGKFCSKGCSGLSRRTRVKRACQICKKHFWVSPYAIKIGGGIFAQENALTNIMQR